MLPWGVRGRACLRNAMMYMFCLRAHRFICIIIFWPTFFSKKYQSPRRDKYIFFKILYTKTYESAIFYNNSLIMAKKSYNHIGLKITEKFLILI